MKFEAARKRLILNNWTSAGRGADIIQKCVYRIERVSSSLSIFSRSRRDNSGLSFARASDVGGMVGILSKLSLPSRPLAERVEVLHQDAQGNF